VALNAAAISAWERRNTTAMRIIYSSIKEEKSRPLMSCDLARDMWMKMETAYSDTIADSTTLLWSRFYGCTFQPEQSVMEFMSEIEHIVSRLRATDAIVLHDDQIIAKVMMSLPSSLKLIFKAGWESTAPEQKTLRNLTTRLVEMERELKKSEKAADALVSKRVETIYKQPSSNDNKSDRGEKAKGDRGCWECGDTSHIRANCRDYKRKLKRKREEEEEERDRKRKRRDQDDDDRRRRDRENNQGRSGRDRDNHDKRDGDYGRDGRDNGRHERADRDRRREYNRGRRAFSYSAATSGSLGDKPTVWFADSAATQHMTGNRDLLINFVPVGRERWMVSGIGDAKMPVAGQGDVAVTAIVNGKTLEGNLRIPCMCFTTSLRINRFLSRHDERSPICTRPGNQLVLHWNGHCGRC